jgi:putative flippase GtrA
MGSVGTAAHFAILFVFVKTLSWNPLLGSTVGFIAGAAINYLLNYHITFKSNNRHAVSFPKFFFIAIAGLGLNTTIMYVAIQSFFYLISQVIATTTVLFWNFICNRFWTFREVPIAKQ